MRLVNVLVERGLVQVNRSPDDGRIKTATLTAAGQIAIDKLRTIVWPQAEAAITQVVEGLSGSFIEQIGAIEKALSEPSLAERPSVQSIEGLTPAVDAELRDLAALINRAYRGSGSTRSLSSDVEYLTGDQTTEARLRNDMTKTPAASLLTWRDGRTTSLKGCVWLEPLGNLVWYLGSLAVDPQRQNVGLGSTLLAMAQEWVQARGGVRIRIEVINVRDRLIDWYARREYHQTGEVKAFPYGDDRYGTPQRSDLSFLIDVHSEGAAWHRRDVQLQERSKLFTPDGDAVALGKMIGRKME